MVQKSLFTRIDEVTWKLPKSFKKTMRTDAILYGTDAIIEQMDDQVIDQITNVASLPGIVGNALAMPDAHMGYGFPIGGVAAFDVNEGIISPGGIGFDINCLVGDTEILLEHGYTKTIAQLKDEWDKEKVMVMDFTKKHAIESRMIYFFAKKPDTPVIKIQTKTGHEVIATADHPILTPRGMIEAGKLRAGDQIAVYPFMGVPYEAPQEDTIIDEEDMRILNLPRHELGAIISELKEKNLLPLRFNSPKLPYLIKLFGYLLGRGTVVGHSEQSKGFACFYGHLEDLEQIRDDIKRLGWIPSKIHTRKQPMPVESKYGESLIQGASYSINVTSHSFVALISALGFPLGNKAEQDFEIPYWMTMAPLWMKRLFLAAYFGAKMSTPKPVTGQEYDFCMPTVYVNKSPQFIASGIKFLHQIKNMLEDFDIQCVEISKEDIAHNGQTGAEIVNLRLMIKQDGENLIKLYSKIGFEYHRKKQFLGIMVAQYLRAKQVMLLTHEASIGTGILQEHEVNKQAIVEVLSVGGHGNEIVTQRPTYEGGKPDARIQQSFFFTFDQFVELNAANGDEGLGWAWDTINSIEELEDFDDLVYDFTVSHDDHNFIANGVIVSNCGMRLIRTNLTLEDVQPKIKELVHTLFRMIPVGAGRKGFVPLNRAEFEEVVTMGVDWCVEHGYAWESDKIHTEDEGRLKDADVEAISERAFKRGKGQLGTLGSGNHYLEIQYVQPEEIHDPKIAKTFGITQENQINIMVHCGSRGFGHQIGTDYLKLFLDIMPKYGIKIFDRELACAPFQSEEGQRYWRAMSAGANMAWANRQVITYQLRKAFEKVMGMSAEDMGMELVYDVCHNIAKVEEYQINGETRRVVVHRKGATRAFGSNRPEIPQAYRSVGQPVIIGGSMETGSYLLAGTQGAMEKSFGSTAHGSGRTMSRRKAKRTIRGDELQRNMEKRGIYVRAASMSGLAEEAGAAYKDIDEVIRSVAKAGISQPIVRLKPIGNIKG